MVGAVRMKVVLCQQVRLFPSLLTSLGLPVVSSEEQGMEIGCGGVSLCGTCSCVFQSLYAGRFGQEKESIGMGWGGTS